MTFLPPEEAKEPLKQTNYRMPVSLLRYLEETAKERGRDKSELVREAIRLTRDLSSRLTKAWPRIQAFAASQQLDTFRDLAEVLARLVEAGLEATPPGGSPKSRRSPERR